VGRALESRPKRHQPAKQDGRIAEVTSKLDMRQTCQTDGNALDNFLRARHAPERNNKIGT
jgi:hypothetical protein